jgi:hypothetical protein
MLLLLLLEKDLTEGQMTLQLLNQLSLLYCTAAVIVAKAILILLLFFIRLSTVLNIELA